MSLGPLSFIFASTRLIAEYGNLWKNTGDSHAHFTGAGIV
jgi:hypothetical protein